MLKKVAKQMQREGKGTDDLKKWGRREISATPGGLGGGLPALKGGDPPPGAPRRGDPETT